MSRFSLVVSAAAAALSLPLTAVTQASMVVSPLGFANSSGTSRDPGPFGFGGANGTAGSHEQVEYDASLFAGFSGPITITSFGLRQNTAGLTASRARSFSEAIVQLSTTTNSENTLSTTFANNSGADATTVFDNALSFSGANPAPSPSNFEFVVTFATPFVYNPANGNLLLDVTVPAGATISGAQGFSSLFDSVNGSNDGEAAVGNTNTAAGTTGVALSTPVTQFTFTAVPEPATLTLLAIGGITTLTRRRRRVVRVTMQQQLE